MKTTIFIQKYLKGKANIAVICRNEIIYEGTVHDIPWDIIKGTELVDLTGPGRAESIILNIVKL